MTSHMPTQESVHETSLAQPPSETLTAASGQLSSQEEHGAGGGGGDGAVKGGGGVGAAMATAGAVKNSVEV